MGYEARAEAAADFIAERAAEMVREGSFSDDIAELILEGSFDDALKQRISDIMEAFNEIMKMKIGDFLIIKGTTVKVQRKPRP